MLPPRDLRGIFRTDLRARAAYAEAAGIYRIVPEAVCLPADTEDLRRLVCWAGDERVPLIPRGAGSAMGGGNVGPGIVVDLTRMQDRRLEVDRERRHAVTSPGITLAELNAEASRSQLRLPPDPSSGGWATLGGMVATNAAGARSVRYGSVRRWVEGLSLLTSSGETLQFRRGKADPERFISLSRAIQAAGSIIKDRFPHTSKNSSGYALDAYFSSQELIDLIIGAEGTLGIVTRIEWQLDRIPGCRAGLRLALRSLDDLSSAVAVLAECHPSAVELLDRSFLDLGGQDPSMKGLCFPGAAAVLLVEIEREDAEALRHALEQTTARSRSLAMSVDTAFSAEAAERLWAIRHAASPILARLPDNRRSLQVIEDACVPVERMGEYIRAVRQAALERDLPFVLFGHAGDGHVHVNLLPEVGQPGWEERVSSLLEEITETVIRLGGTPSGEHGDGRLRSQAMTRLYGPEIIELFRRVKDSFDPAGIFNPGVILPSGDPPISHLKVGAGAAPLPADVAQALRDIERMGGYGRCRLELAGGSGARSRESEG
jgi:FAD/FMN-containing dehydrogenase